MQGGATFRRRRGRIPSRDHLSAGLAEIGLHGQFSQEREPSSNRRPGPFPESTNERPVNLPIRDTSSQSGRPPQVMISFQSAFSSLPDVVSPILRHPVFRLSLRTVCTQRFHGAGDVRRNLQSGDASRKEGAMRLGTNPGSPHVSNVGQKLCHSAQPFLVMPGPASPRRSFAILKLRPGSITLIHFNDQKTLRLTEMQIDGAPIARANRCSICHVWLPFLRPHTSPLLSLLPSIHR